MKTWKKGAIIGAIILTLLTLTSGMWRWISTILSLPLFNWLFDGILFEILGIDIEALDYGYVPTVLTSIFIGMVVGGFFGWLFSNPRKPREGSL